MTWWPMPSGTTVAINRESGELPPPSGHTAVSHEVVVASTGGQVRPVRVRFDEPNYVNTLRIGNGLQPLTVQDRGRLARIAALRSVNEDPTFFEEAGPLQVDLGFNEVKSLEEVPRIPNQALRRYIARRLYLAWEENGLDEFVEFGDMDAVLTGASAQDVLRNLQVLEQEGYVELSRTMGTTFRSFSARAGAKLIREVERYGAAREDVESELEFASAIRATPGLDSRTAGILAERQRYEAARSPDEVVSVFRALFPIVEGVVREVLRTNGCQREHTSLGPMIGEMKSRNLGTIGLRSQLNALVTNSRDISLHGGDVTLPVLRISIETAFGVLPQLGAYLPAPE